MGGYAAIREIGNGPKDKAVVQLLRVVNFVPTRNAAPMEVAN